MGLDEAMVSDGPAPFSVDHEVNWTQFWFRFGLPSAAKLSAGQDNLAAVGNVGSDWQILA